MKRTITYQIDGGAISLCLENDTFFGKPEVLLSYDDDLIADVPWSDSGYTVAPFLDPKMYGRLVNGIRAIFKFHLSELGVEELDGFELQDYHKLVNDQRHLAMVERFRDFFPHTSFPIPLELMENRISEICKVPLTNDSHTEYGKFFFVRMVRPCGKNDFNPPHRDVYLDRIRHAVNIYLPIAGSNQHSSLPVLPGSHNWNEADVERTDLHPVINGVQFTVPCITGNKNGELKMIRPNPAPNEVLVFSPYMIHGGAVNNNEDVTRISLEMRFWRKR